MIIKLLDLKYNNNKIKNSRTCKTKDIDGNKIDSVVRYSRASQSEAYWNYCKIEKNISFSTFRKHTSNIYKRAFRWTDVI